MEIKFDLQLFANVQLPGTNPAAAKWLKADGSECANQAAPSDAAMYWDNTNYFIVQTDTITSLSTTASQIIKLVASLDTTTPTAPTAGIAGTAKYSNGTNTFDIAIGTADASVTFNAGVLSAASSIGTTSASVSAGVLNISANIGAAAQLPVSLTSATASVSYTGTLTSATIHLPGTTGDVVITEGTNAVATVVRGNSSVTGLDNGGTVEAPSGVSVTTATSAINDAFTINNILYTLTTASTTPLVFTADATTATGASAVTGLSGGVLTTSGADTVAINNKKYVGTTALTVAGNTAGTTSTLTAGDVTIDSTATSSVDTTFETGNGSISISNGRATVRAAAGTASQVLGLTAGASLTAKYGTGLTVAAVAGTRESSTYTVNDMTFTQGFSAANATSAMTFRTTTSGATLINGSAYLNGSGTVVVSNTGATAESTISSTNGDITITANGAGGFEIGDLDNGDSFTVTVGTDRRTYTVSNGRLFDSLGNVSAASFNASDSTYASVLVVSGITAGTVFDASGTGLTGLAGAITSSTNLNTSHGSLAPASDVTGRSLGVSSVTGAAAAGSMRTVTEYANGNYLHTNGLVDSTSTDALGTLDSTSDYFTYTATGTKGQTIDMNNALAVTGAADNGVWKIVGTGAADHIFGNGRGSTLDGGAGADTIVAAAGDIALGGEGNDELTAVGNNVTLSGGAGADTLTAVSSATGTTTLTGGDGADVFVINDGTARSAVITDFDFANDVLYDNVVAASSAFASITSAQVNANGGINLSGGTATVNATNGAYFAQVRGNDNRKQAIGWVGEAATAVDASSMTASAVIIGDTNTEGDSLYGGSAGDTIYGGASDTVYGGAGRNFVTLSGAATDTMHVLGFGVDNAIAHDVVSGFTTGFEAENSDKLLLVGGVTTVSTSLTGAGAAGQLTIKSGSSDLILQNVNVNGTTNAAEVRVGDSKVAFVASGSVATVSSASYADMYFGTKSGSIKSGLSFANVEDSLEVNLSDSKYTNIASVIGGTGNTSLLGGSDAETLISAGGNTSLYGGAGKDVLVGRTAAADTFFALDGIGTDTVSGFEGYTENTAETADTVYLSSVSAAKLDSNGITLNVNDSDKVVLTGTSINANTEVRFTTDGTTFGIAKIGSVAGGNNFTYAKEVTYYGGGSGNDTLTFSSGDSDDHQVWLDGSKGVSYSKVNIVNGASASGSLVLAGDSAKNTITGGSGDDSLWGGSGNTADRLTGNSGANTFFYGLGEGNDTLVSSSADDTVKLYNISLSDIKSGEITNAGVTVNMNDGSTLTVATSKDIKFNLASGESYIANHSTKQWDNA